MTTVAFVVANSYAGLGWALIALAGTAPVTFVVRLVRRVPQGRRDRPLRGRRVRSGRHRHREGPRLPPRPQPCSRQQ